MMQHLNQTNFRAGIHQLWQPLLLGAFVLGITAAACGYVIGQFVWRARVIYLLRRRRLRATTVKAALD
jgi:uncharacterized protein (DUF2062 family)